MNERDSEIKENAENSSWPLVQQWIRSAKNSVEVLKDTYQVGEMVLHQLGITSRSPMGAVSLNTGGIFFDHGWLRLLGSGSEQMRSNLLGWNGIGDGAIKNMVPGVCIVAYDVIGGFFAVNGGGLTGNQGEVFYLAPDTLQWESLQMSYSQFLSWSFFGDLEGFYKPYRWSNWEQDLLRINGDQGISVYPFLWSNINLPMDARSRNIVPMVELWNIQQNIGAQI